MDQIANFLIGPMAEYLNAHPKLMAGLVAVLVINLAVKAFVDSLVSSRAQWDKTPLSDDTWYEKALTWAVRITGLLGKAAAYTAGFRPKSKAEIKQDPK